MEVDMKVIMWMGRKKGMESSIGVMEMYLKVSSQTTEYKDKVHIDGLIKESMQENGKTTK